MSETARTNAGSKLYIGTTKAINFTTPEGALADFETDDYTKVENVSNVGEFGSTANIVTFPTLSDNYVQKGKGTRNAGDPAIVVGRDSGDPGQLLVRAAEKDNFYRNFKYVLDDAGDENHTPTIFYFRALVAGVPGQFGGNEDFVTETYNLGIYPGPIVVERAAITSP